jgi:carbamoyl-phosphate synthase small subunit
MTYPKATLVLEDGTVYEGIGFGYPGVAVGEVVFNTGMTGYQEVLTDPSYAGQLVVMTYPLIGNYGINADDFESARIQVAGFVVREVCEEPSNFRAQKTLHEFLADHRIPGIAKIDTRGLVRKLRIYGVMMGALGVGKDAEELFELLRKSPRYDELDFVQLVSTRQISPMGRGA